ncbi:MAG: hypothetical protein ACJA1R_001920, partial [Flavobacteriales bacterium]
RLNDVGQLSSTSRTPSRSWSTTGSASASVLTSTKTSGASTSASVSTSVAVSKASRRSEPTSPVRTQTPSRHSLPCPHTSSLLQRGPAPFSPERGPQAASTASASDASHPKILRRPALSARGMVVRRTRVIEPKSLAKRGVDGLRRASVRRYAAGLSQSNLGTSSSNPATADWPRSVAASSSRRYR